MTSMNDAQDLARHLINARRNSVLALLESSVGYRNCSAYLARQIDQSRRLQQLRRPSLARLFLAIFIDQIILIVLFAFLLGPPLLATQGGIFARDTGVGIGPFSLSSLATASCVFSTAACLALQLFLFTARFEGSTWQTTPGRMLLGMKSCDSEGDPLSFEDSFMRLMGQHLLVCIATMTIIMPTSYGLKQAFANDYLRVLLPMVPLFAYFCMSSIRVDHRTIFQMVSRQTIINTDDVPTRSMRSILMEGLHILFFGDLRGSGKARLDLCLTTLSILSYLWLGVSLSK